ncbi:MAG TPA: prefoldin subunit beta [Candidatus Nitrosotenuis sp.]|nr:prefoldin subunit beta [Candidatus Nitrosotenuis sp.]
MSSGQQIPPWLQEQLMKLQQSQQNLQSIMAQKQQLDVEQLESDRALEELKKAADADPVYKHAGSILIKSTKAALIAELEERKELANTRSTVLAKQETRVKESIKEQETKINEMIRGTQKPNPQQNINNQSRS